MNVADSIENIFRLQIDAFTAFRDVLSREHVALTQRKLQDIDACFVEHAQCITHLEKLDREFKSVMKKAGAGRAAKDIDQILAMLPANYRSRLQALWMALLALVTECRDQNELNSRLININRQNTEAALRVLKGQTSVPVTTYAPDGKVSTPSTQPAIATA